VHTKDVFPKLLKQRADLGKTRSRGGCRYIIILLQGAWIYGIPYAMHPSGSAIEIDRNLAPDTRGSFWGPYLARLFDIPL
jgi:hypothetical protein